MNWSLRRRWQSEYFGCSDRYRALRGDVLVMLRLGEPGEGASVLLAERGAGRGGRPGVDSDEAGGDMSGMSGRAGGESMNPSEQVEQERTEERQVETELVEAADSSSAWNEKVEELEAQLDSADRREAALAKQNRELVAKNELLKAQLAKAIAQDYELEPA